MVNLDRIDYEFKQLTKLPGFRCGVPYWCNRTKCEFFLLINSPRLNLQDQTIMKLDFMMLSKIFRQFNALKKPVDLFMPLSALSARGVSYDATVLLTAILEYLRIANHRFGTFGHDQFLD